MIKIKVSDNLQVIKMFTIFSIEYKIEEKEEILIYSLLSYPSAVRILNLLYDGKVKTKFELGKNLVFIGIKELVKIYHGKCSQQKR